MRTNESHCRGAVPRYDVTVPLFKSKYFIIRSCPILVLTTVLGQPRHASAKNSVKDYQWPTRFAYSFFLLIFMGL